MLLHTSAGVELHEGILSRDISLCEPLGQVVAFLALRVDNIHQFSFYVSCHVVVNVDEVF